jgi:exopolysaccharide (amylovoran) exporter
MSGLKSSASFTLASSLISGGLQVLQLSIAAHELSTSEYALLAMVNVTLGIISVLQDAGLINFGVQLQEFSKKINSTLFWISSSFGLVAAILMLAAAPVLERFYSLQGLSAALCLASVNLVILGLSSTYQSIYIKLFKAKALAIAEIAARPIAFLAFWYMLHVHNFGIYSVIWSAIIFGAAKLLFMVLMAEKEWHPGLQFDRKIASAALGFGSYQFGAQIINQLRAQIDQLVLAKVLPASDLGVYALAKDLSMLPFKFFQPLFSRLALPLYAKAKKADSELREAAIKGLSLTSNISFLVYGALAAFAPLIVFVMYGDRHGPINDIVCVLCLFAALRPIGLNTAMLAQSKGRTDVEFKWNLIAGILSVGLFLALSPFVSSPIGFAILSTAIQLVTTIASYELFLKPIIDVGFRSFLNSWAAGFTALCIATGALYFFAHPLMISALQ